MYCCITFFFVRDKTLSRPLEYHLVVLYIIYDTTIEKFGVKFVSILKFVFLKK